MDYFRFYQVPTNPLARFLLALAAGAILVLSFFLGVLVLAVVAGLAVMGALYLAVMRWVYRLKRGGKQEKTDPLEVEYRVVRKERK